MGDITEGTFLAERLLGISAYLLLTLFSYLAIKSAKSYEDISRTLNITLLILCVMAFFYVPATSADLFRWRKIIANWDQMSFRQFFNSTMKTSSTPLAYLLFYITEKAGIPGLLPSFACFVYHLVVFSIIKSETKRRNLTAKAVSVVYFFFMSQGLFLGVISSIRNGLAFAIAAYCVYKDLVLKEKRLFYCILSLFSIFIHVSMVPLVAIYLSISVFLGWSQTKWVNNFIKFLLFTPLVYYVINFRSDLIELVTEKAENYLSGNYYSYRWEFLIAIMAWGCMVYIIARYKKSFFDNNMTSLFVYCVVILVMVILLIKSYSIFHRFTNFVNVLAIPILLITCDGEMREGNIVFNRNILIISAAILLLACTRGDLCGYKFLAFS